MKKETKHLILAVLFIFGITLLVFWNSFSKGLVPYPGNFMLAWYEPWKTDHMVNQTITLVHKAVADDTFRQFLPFRLLATDLFKQFELPLWNPYNGSGMPLLATMNIGLLNPFMIFFVLFSAPLAWTLHIIFQFIIVCFFMYLYCRSIGMKLLSSLFTVSVFAFSGFVIVRLVFGDYIYTLAGLPLLLYLIEKYIQNAHTKKIFLVAPSILFILLSGAPQIIFYVLLTIVCYAFYRIRHVKKILFFFLQCLFGIGLASIQLFPTAELYQNATITTDSSKFIFDRFLLPIQHFISIVIPNYFGNQGTYNYWGAGDYIETIAAIGSIPFLFAVFYILGEKRGNNTVKIFFFVAFCVSIIFSLDWIGSRAFFSLPIPILSTGIPSRILFIATFSIAILAGLGFEKLISNKYSLRSLAQMLSPFIFFILFIGVASYFLLETNSLCPNRGSNLSCYTIAFRNTVIEILVFSIFLSILTLSYIKNHTLTKNFQIIIILIVVTIGVYNAYKFLPFSDKDTLLPKNELITYLQNHTRDGRVFGFDEANIKTDFATTFRFLDPNYYDPLYIKRYGELVAYAKNDKVLRSDVELDQSENISTELQQKRTKLLNLLSVKYFVYKQSKLSQDRENTIWKNNHWIIQKNEALPHAYFVNNYQIISDDQLILTTLFSDTFNPATTAIVEKEVPLNISDEKIGSLDHVEIQQYHENNITIDSSTKADRLLIITDNYYPGWKAYIDNKQTDIFRTNYTFRGIIVPKGDHQITFIYQPDSLRYGIYTSLIALFMYICSYIFVKRIKISQ